MKKDYSALKMYKRLLRHVIPYWYLVVAALAFTFAISFISPFIAESLRRAFFAIEDKDLKVLLLYALLSFLAVLGSTVLHSIKNYLVTLFSAESSLNIESHLFSHINSLPMEYFHKNHSGDVIARLTNDVNGVRGIIGGQAFNLLQIPLNAIVAVIYGIRINCQITLMLLIVAPLPLITNFIFNKRLRETSQEAHKLWARI